MVDTLCDDCGSAPPDRMSDAPSSENPLPCSSGRPSCSSCSGSSRPSSGGGSAFRSKCPTCKTRHRRKQPCRQNAMDADPSVDYPAARGPGSVVCIRVPSNAASVAPAPLSPTSAHFDLPARCSTASEASSSCGAHSTACRHRKSARKRSEHAKRSCHGGGTPGSGGKDSANLLANLKAFFNKWLDTAKASKAAHPSQHHLLVNGEAPGFHHHSNGLVLLQQQQQQQQEQQQQQQQQQQQYHHHHTIMSLNSSFDSDYRLHYNPNSSVCSTGCHSTASIPTTLSTTTVSEPPSAGFDLTLLSEVGDSRRYWMTHVDYDVFLRHNPRLMGKQYLSAQNPLVPSLSCPTKSKSLQSQGSKQKDLLCSTWPPSGKRVFMPETEEEFQLDHDDVLIERMTKEHLYEFNIPFSDIKFNECLKTGSRRKIHRGQWHGEVMIHTYDHLNHKEISKFWEEVQKLSMVRHENIALFMGASMDPPNFAVVTETRKGCSLYEKLHVSREKSAQSFKLNILRQLAQALGYLHAKGIVVKRLNSKHIFLEPKVKVCLLDFSWLEDEEGRDSALFLSTNMVYYLAPELLTASFTVESNRYCDEKHFTTCSDVFAFGTIMYEVQTGRYPFFKMPSQNVMEAICEGKREDIKELRCSDTVKNLIQECWLHSALDRPEMSDINKELQHRNAAHKRHSSSEPENLHRLTFGKVSYL